MKLNYGFDLGNKLVKKAKTPEGKRRIEDTSIARLNRVADIVRSVKAKEKAAKRAKKGR